MQENKLFTRRTIFALICLSGPTALYILTVSYGALVYYPVTGDSSLALNNILLTLMIISFVTWIPGIVAGILLLTIKPKGTHGDGNSPSPPTVTPHSPESLTAQKARRSLYLTWGLVLLIIPTILVICASILFTAGLFANLSSSGSSSSEVLYIIGYVLGGIGTLTWIPGIAIGILLLVRRSRLRSVF